mgnify:CR=1 FL=1
MRVAVAMLRLIEYGQLTYEMKYNVTTQTYMGAEISYLRPTPEVNSRVARQIKE